MKKIITLTSITLIHAIVSWILFLITFSSGMHRFDTGELPSIGERLIETLSTILLWPIFYPFTMWGGKIFRNLFHGLLGYIPLIFNSFIWAIVIYWILRANLRKKKDEQQN